MDERLETSDWLLTTTRAVRKRLDFDREVLDPMGDRGATARIQFRAVVEYMKQEDLERSSFFRFYTMNLDRLRSERFAEIFPELARLQG